MSNSSSPHVYKVANSSLVEILYGKSNNNNNNNSNNNNNNNNNGEESEESEVKNQSIIISGESGAGKVLLL